MSTLPTYDSVIRGRADLHGFQREAIRFLHDHPHSALFMDVGMGKAICALTYLADLLNRGWTGKALVIAPLRVARATWPDEVKEWKQAAGIPYSLIRAEDDDPEVISAYQNAYAKERGWGERPDVAAKFAAPARARAKESIKQRQALDPAPLHIVNVEGLIWLIDFHFANGSWPYDTIIIDESSKFKSYATARFRAMRRVLPAIKRIHELTASPAPETYIDLFSQIYLLDQGERLGSHITHFRNRHFFQPHHRSRKWVMKRGHDEKISTKISDICHVSKTKDHLDVLKVQEWLPLKRKIVLPPRLMEVYREFEKTSIMRFAGEDIEAMNGAVLVNKLLQVSSGAIYNEERKVIPVHDAKVDEIRELREELQGSPLLVAYWYKSSLDRLRKAFPDAVVMDEAGACIADWNAGKVPMLLLHAAGSAHGLNMQKGPGHDLAFFDLPWSRELYEQVIGRIARQGQKDVPRVHHLLVVGTADEAVYNALQSKGAMQEQLFDYIRAARAHTA